MNAISPSFSGFTQRDTVYVVDDDEAVRDSLSWLLDSSGFSVKCFSSAEDFLQSNLLREFGCLLLDVRMQGMSGLELHDELIKRGSGLPLIFITGHGDVPMAVARIKKGAVDFIEKPFNHEELTTLIRSALSNARTLHASRATEQAQEQRTANLLAKLSAREAQVLERIVAGRLNKQIADDFAISIKTVEAHRANLMDKLEVRTMAELMKVALTTGSRL